MNKPLTRKEWLMAVEKIWKDAVKATKPKKWRGLTAKERTELWWSIDMSGQPEHVYGKAIEAKLKEKNHAK